MKSAIWGLIFPLLFMFLTFSAFMIWSYMTDKLKMEALKMAKELAEKATKMQGECEYKDLLIAHNKCPADFDHKWGGCRNAEDSPEADRRKCEKSKQAVACWDKWETAQAGKGDFVIE